MSDFVNSGWSIFIAITTVVSLLACLLLLFFASRRRPMADDNSTGHVYDENLVEMNNPLPRWWAILFVITVAFAFVYVYAFPALGSAPGSLGWSSQGQLSTDEAKARSDMAKVYAPFAQLPAEVLSQDKHAMAIGERLFLNNCAPCHGSDARGSKGFPNLTDDDWLYGGSPQRIEETITLGRVGTMPSMAAAVGTAQDVVDVANYVLSLSNSPHNSISAYSGKKKFVICAACHGVDGKGNQTLGAPNLTDNIWLFGYGEAAIVSMVTSGKTSVMPAQRGRLSPEQIHVVASYVWSLSHREQKVSR